MAEKTTKRPTETAVERDAASVLAATEMDNYARHHAVQGTQAGPAPDSTDKTGE